LYVIVKVHVNEYVNGYEKYDTAPNYIVAGMNTPILLTVTAADAGLRLDKFIVQARPSLSRTRVQALITDGLVQVNRRTTVARYPVRSGDVIEVNIPVVTPMTLRPEPIPLEFLYQDADIAVINKQPDLVVHPLPGTSEGTLVNALLHHCPDLSGINGVLRPGIVHRLDKDTSGCMVIAKNDRAHAGLAAQFKDRSVTKHYYALAWGVFAEPAGSVETAIGRDLKDRTLMTTRPRRGRPAISHYQVISQYALAAAVDVHIVTGRTHQVRVHLAHLKHPVVGDNAYGGDDKVAGHMRAAYLPLVRLTLKKTDRLALHAWRIAFKHPLTGQELQFEAPLPEDIRRVEEFLKTAQ
jgi:23S rRNA pseudouridine1911/1915/1917 synthase